MVPVDGPMDMVQEAIMDHFEGTACAMPRPITRCLAPTSREYQPDIIGHFDLLMKNNRQQELIDPENPQYIKAATDAMDEAITGCNLLEINTGGMARHGAPDPTPCPACCAIGARSAGGDLAADCHQAEQIAFGYEAASQLIREAGYKKAAFLGRQDVLFEWSDVN